MTGYERPVIDAPQFHDADGAVIEYGARWAGSPPEDSYSVDTHPERFAPLHAVAEALTEHLRTEFDVRVDEGAEVAADLLRPVGREVLRAVRLRPRDSTCASLTFVFDDYPGLAVHSGLLHDAYFPHCGCDACDEEWRAVADDLERDVFAVVAGGFRERIARGGELPVEYALSYPDGSASGSFRLEDVPAHRLDAARTVLDALPDGWAPWPRRAPRGIGARR
ncbi:MAG: DUF6226 family protein [Microbacterium arborescens]